MPRDLYLNKCDISHVGQVEEVTQLCADVNELHLADNNISQWEEVSVSYTLSWFINDYYNPWVMTLWILAVIPVCSNYLCIKKLML